MDSQHTKEQQRRSNLRMGLILASIVAVFFFGFMAKMVYLGH